MDTNTQNRIDAALNLLKVEKTGDGEDDYTFWNSEKCDWELRAAGVFANDARRMVAERIDKLLTEAKSKQYWLITMREQYIHDSQQACISTNVFDHGPAKVLLDCQKCAGKESGYSDTQILFAVQITKQEYDDYKKWEDSL